MSESPADTLLTRPFLLIWSLAFLTFFAAFQLFPTVPLRLRELGATLAESGRFLSVFTVGSAFGALVTGPLGDRIGHRRMVMTTAVLFALCVGSYGLLTRVRWFYLVALPHGIVWSGLLTSTMATLSHVLPERRRVDGLSIYGLASPMGVVFGPVLGLWIHHHWGFPVMALFLAALFVLLAVLSTGMPQVTPSRERRPAIHLPEAAVAAPCLILFASALGYGALNSYSAQEALALGFSFPAAFLTAMALGMVAMRLTMARVGFGARPIRLLPSMLALTALGMGILALPGGFLRHGIAGLLYGAGYSMMHTLLNAHLLETVNPQRRGAAFGALLFAFDSGIGLGAFVLGWLIGLRGYRWGWGAGAALLLVSLALGIRMAAAPTSRSVDADPDASTSG